MKELIVSRIKIEYLSELKDRKIYDKVIEILEQRITSIDQLAHFESDTINAKNFAHFMRSAFSWKTTKDGFSYWFDIVFPFPYCRFEEYYNDYKDEMYISHQEYIKNILNKLVDYYTLCGMNKKCYGDLFDIHDESCNW